MGVKSFIAGIGGWNGCGSGQLGSSAFCCALGGIWGSGMAGAIWDSGTVGMAGMGFDLLS